MVGQYALALVKYGIPHRIFLYSLISTRKDQHHK